MLYSVVIPLYNSEHTIIKTLKSVENQTRYDLIEEIIIVNDGSTDKSVDVIKNYISKSKNNKIVIINQKNSGAAKARNVGINYAKNDFIALLDSDDQWVPNKMEIQNEILSSNKKIKALGSNRINESIKLGCRIDKKIYRISPFTYCIKNWPCTPSFVFSKSLFKEDVYFPEDMSHSEEGIFFLRIAYESGLYYCIDNLVLCGEGKRGFGVSGLSGNISKMHLGIIEMLNKAKYKGYISDFSYIFLKIYEFIKYIRRIIIVYLDRR